MGIRQPDRLHERVHQAYRQARRRLGRALARLRGFKHNMHYAAVNFLLRRWDVVIASTASMGEMTRRATRPFGSRVARRALNRGHYAFRQRLTSAAELWPGRSVIETGEAFTTRALRCAQPRRRTGGCVAPGCDRDVNGARNIALRVLIDRN